MSKRVPLKVLYKYSLPVHPLALPELFPHNPISWLTFIYAYLTAYNTVNKTTISFEEGLFLVHDPNDIKILWADGFFGKGSLSRSEASWFDRTQKRLGIGEFKNLTVEEITAIRRDERKKFKKERAKLEAKQAELKKQGIVDPFIEERLSLKNLRDKDINVKIERELIIRKEDDVLKNSSGELINIEYLQLQPEEAFFLKFALNAVDIFNNGVSLTSEDLFSVLSDNKPDNSFLLKYVVYHHYRTLGWCVRSGIKFGTDYLLYKKGPPFHHAEFALSVFPNYEDESKNQELSKDFVWLSSTSRVIGGVRKTFILSFVSIPTQEEYDAAEDLASLLKLYTVDEIIYKRWVANKNRD